MRKNYFIVAALLSWTQVGLTSNPASIEWVKNYVQSVIATIPAGPQGPAGPTGPSGQGVPPGGTTGQVLTKQTDANYDTIWETPASGSGLTTADWAALCPAGQSLSNAAGCQPDCTGSQATACNTVLNATQILATLALPAPSSNSVIAFSFTPSSTKTTRGPVMQPPTQNNARCITFNVTGNLQPQVISDASVNSLTSTLPVGAILRSAGGSQSILIYSIAPTSLNGFSAASNTYYVICLGYTISSNASISADVTGVTAIWS